MTREKHNVLKMLPRYDTFEKYYYVIWVIGRYMTIEFINWDPQTNSFFVTNGIKTYYKHLIYVSMLALMAFEARPNMDNSKVFEYKNVVYFGECVGLFAFPVLLWFTTYRDRYRAEKLFKDISNLDDDIKKLNIDLTNRTIDKMPNYLIMAILSIYSWTFPIMVYSYMFQRFRKSLTLKWIGGVLAHYKV